MHQWPSALRAHAARLGTSVAGIGNILLGNRCLHQTRCYSSPTIREQITAKSGRSQATQCANPAQTPRDCSIRHKRRSSPCVLLRSAFTRSTPRSQRSTINSSSWLPRPRRGDLATRNRHRKWRPAPDHSRANIDLIASEAAFARLRGVASIPASSGETHRMRFHRGRDRQSNRALHMIAVCRLPVPLRRTNTRLHATPPGRGTLHREGHSPRPQEVHRPRSLPRSRKRPRHPLTFIGPARAIQPPPTGRRRFKSRTGRTTTHWFGNHMTISGHTMRPTVISTVTATNGMTPL